MSYTKQLQDIGIEKEIEAKIYLACLKLGVAKISELNKDINAPRTSIYGHIKNLIKKGYISESNKRGVKYFSPVDPSKILKKKMENLKIFHSVIPKLKNLLSFSNNKIEVKYFDTKEGILNLYNSLLESNPKHPFFFIEHGKATKYLTEEFGLNFWYKWQKKFLAKGITAQGIITNDVISYFKSAPKKIKGVLIERSVMVKIVDEKDFLISINLYLVYPNFSYIEIPEEDFLISIENKKIYETLLLFYQLLSEKGKVFDFKTILSN